MTAPDLRPQAALDVALNLIQTTASAAVARVSEALANLVQSSTRAAERELLTSTQFEMRRQMGSFHQVFKDTMREKVRQDTAPREEAKRKPAGAASWQTLSLVDDHEVEERMFADRIGQLIAHECEAELRELNGYMGALLATGRADPERNPLRAEVLGTALYRAIETISEQSEVRKLLARNLGKAMALAMPACYAQILQDLQARGVQPLVLTVRGVEGPGHMLPGLNSAYQGLTPTGSPSGEFGGDSSGHSLHPTTLQGRTGRGASAMGGVGSRSGIGGGGGGAGGGGSGSTGALSEAQLMTLLRRLTVLASRPGDLDSGPRHSGAGVRTGASGPGFGTSIHGGAPGLASGGRYSESINGAMAVNLIRAHREELLQASTGKLDHMVIDVVGSLFDQILSDTRVPPQMARQIARLQLPVLRVALNDASFFSSRRHPVRRFVNRIASLACAFDDFDDGPGKELLSRVRELVQEIVEGDFDQIELYSAKLAELGNFIADQTDGALAQTGAVQTLEGKESELRVQQRYMMQLQSALTAIPLPPYLADFLPQVWSQAVVLAVRRDGVNSDRAQRYRRVGRELVMSVQPKGSPILRKKFLMQLPPLMKDLNEGMQLIGWPEAAQREFFGKLLPAHAESLKGQPLSELDYNMMSKQLEAVFNTPVPGIETLSAADPLPEIDEAVVAQRFSPEEAKRVGFVPEASVDWSGKVDIDIDFDSEPPSDSVAEASTHDGSGPAALSDSSSGIDINLDLSSAEPPEPSRGPQLIDHVKVGFAYQMHLKDEWQKVRLAHVSPGRSFFVFTHGVKHKETISMTSRMLARMCETNRMRAVESSYLMERATQRARKQLAALKAPTRH